MLRLFWQASLVVLLLAAVAPGSARGDEPSTVPDTESGGEEGTVGPASVVDPDWVETLVATHVDGGSRITDSRRVVAGDIDGDGDEDMAAAHYAAATVSWYENDGSGSFMEHTITTSFSVADTVYIADVDGDGDQDIVAGSGSVGIQWFENDGSQSFTAHTVTTSFDCHSVVAVDLDQDGDVDFVSADGTRDELHWWSNDGTQTFSQEVLASGLVDIVWVATGDMDNDGDYDIVVAAFTDDVVTLFVNDGAQVFTSDSVGSSVSPACARVADINGDGAMDVVAVSFLDGVAFWFESDGAVSDGGSPTFARHKLGSAFGMASVYPADIDDDGDMDVVSAAWTAGSVQWYENMDGTGGNWTEHEIVTDQTEAVALFAADFDSDGRTDVALIFNSGNSALAVYQNNHASVSASPTEAPTDAPTNVPSQAPTDAPTNAPTRTPTDAPTQAPSQALTDAPTNARTQAPTEPPTVRPTADWLADFWESLYAVVDNHEKVWKYAKALDKLDTATYSGIRADAKDITKLINKSYFKTSAAEHDMRNLIAALDQDADAPLLRGPLAVDSNGVGVHVADAEDEALDGLRKYLNKVMKKCEDLNNGVLYFEYYDLLANLNSLA